MSADHPVLDALKRLPPISLPDLQAEAAFLTRRDRKYLVPFERATLLLRGIDSATRILEIDGLRCFTYLTPYFDDPGFTAYLTAARRRPNRFKVRTRLYAESGICHLEVKLCDRRGRTLKQRIEHDPRSPTTLSAQERTWLGSFPQVAPFAPHLRHCVTTHYRRSTLVLSGGAARVTIDRNLVFELPDGSARSISGYVAIETKGAGAPTWFDRLLWRNGFRPVAWSKFACGIGLLIPNLPSNRWHRVLGHLLATCGGEAWPIPEVLESEAYSFPPVGQRMATAWPCIQAS